MALRVNHAGVTVRTQVVSFAADDESFFKFRKQHHPADGRLGGGSEEAMIAAGVEADDCRRGEAAETVGFEPFALEAGIEVHSHSPLCCNSLATTPVQPVW